MHELRVASRYAKSLLDISLEKGILEDVQKDMLSFVKICEGNHELIRVFKNPIIDHSKKLAILDALLKGKVNEMTLSIFKIISKKNREAYLYHIAKEFSNQYRIFKGIESAEVKTTFPLTDARRTSFINLVAGSTGKKVELKETIDEEIIGGYVLNIGDKQIDESVKNKIQRLKIKFKDNPYIAKY